jgi:uncharacterized protein YjiK
MFKSPPGYNFSIFDKKSLELTLREISGIVWDRERNFFLAVEDEGGDLYMLDRESKKIMAPSPFAFAERGDYEDIALIDTIPYILRSDGTIFRCSTDTADHFRGTEIGKLELPDKSDFESMFYDPNRKALVILCKNCDHDPEDKISAFAYYPDSLGFDNKPIFQIDRAEIKKLSPSGNKNFQPSAAAIHPRQQKIYILSGSSKEMAITDLNGKVEGVYSLIASMFPQAEGIAFRPN